jgi:hypothetical protein
MRTWKTIILLVMCLSLLVAGTALAEKGEKTCKVMCAASGDEKEMKVEVTEEDGKAHVKIWHMEDGKEVLVEEFDADADDERVLKLDGEHMIMIRADGDDNEWTTKICDGKVMFHGDSDEDFYFVGGDHDLSWVGESGTYLGVQLADLDEEKAEYFETDEGALVTGVIDESPAAEAGFKIYDIIVKIDDTDIANPGDAIKTVSDHEKGDEVEVTVLRKGKKKTIKATLGEHDMHGYAFGENMAPHVFMKRFQAGDHDKALDFFHHRLTPGADFDEDELENLRADVEELRALLEELKADKN